MLSRSGPALLLACALVVAACSDDGADAPETEPSAASTAPDTTAAPTTTATPTT
ncbi:MAG: hypothetical protein H0U21_17655, partial [Acidimicrobiia bacterium]|nr:hypothetical protein [Acidimicrobiia bacterium]